MKVFFAYLKRKRRSIFLFGAVFLILWIVLGVYRLPTEPVAYSFALCGLVLFIEFVSDFLRFRKRHQLLSHIQEEILNTDENLPQAANLLEEDYQILIRNLFQKKAAIETQALQKQEDMLSYYTMWVHQIKTPIAAMRLLLQESGGEHRGLEGELFRVEEYVEMVLCYLRLGSTTTDYRFYEYDLDKILRQAVRKYAPLFIRKKIALQYEPVHFTVLTDEKWLLFVVEQVLSNALKYTASGSITVAFHAPATLSIRDTGIGIAPEDLPRIFECGFTGCNGRLDKKSTGIGLYLCRRICKNLGHNIGATSQIGQGTEIQIDLRRRDLEIE